MPVKTWLVFARQGKTRFLTKPAAAFKDKHDPPKPSLPQGTLYRFRLKAEIGSLPRDSLSVLRFCNTRAPFMSFAENAESLVTDFGLGLARLRRGLPAVSVAGSFR